jgi:hypothetical protein
LGRLRRVRRIQFNLNRPRAREISRVGLVPAGIRRNEVVPVAVPAKNLHLDAFEGGPFLSFELNGAPSPDGKDGVAAV